MGWPGKFKLASWRSSSGSRRMRGDSANEQELMQNVESVVACRLDAGSKPAAVDDAPQRRLQSSSLDVLASVAAMDLTSRWVDCSQQHSLGCTTAVSAGTTRSPHQRVISFLQALQPSRGVRVCYLRPCANASYTSALELLRSITKCWRASRQEPPAVPQCQRQQPAADRRQPAIYGMRVSRRHAPTHLLGCWWGFGKLASVRLVEQYLWAHPALGVPCGMERSGPIHHLEGASTAALTGRLILRL